MVCNGGRRTMTFEMIILGLIAAAPSVVAIAESVIATLFIRRITKKDNAEVKAKLDEVLSVREYKELKAELRAAHAENRELKKMYMELLTRLDRVQRTEE